MKKVMLVSGSWLESPSKFQKIKLKIKSIIIKIIGKKNTQKIVDAKRRRREKKEMKTQRLN